MEERMISKFSDFKDYERSNYHYIDEYFGTKYLHELTIEELAYIHLDTNSTCNIVRNCKLYTCLRDLLETVSASFNNIRTKQYVPLFTCFSILDQIGQIYGRLDKTTKYKNGIKRALALYSSLNDSESLDLLVTLRHCLFHNGSLAGINDQSKKETKIFFRMAVDSGRLLTPAKEKWDGIYRNEMGNYTTKIDLKELQKITVSVVETCRNKHLEGKLRILVPDPKEFFYKYLFHQKL